MKSNQQRKDELTAKRQAQQKQDAAEQSAAQQARRERDIQANVPVDINSLPCANVYPEFVTRGYYVDEPFT